MYIYIDVLILTSVYIDYLMIRASAALLHRRLRTSRCIAGALAGSLFSLSVLLPPLGTAADIIFKALSAAVIVLAAFGFGDVRSFFTASGVFFAVSWLFAGICIFFSQSARGKILYRNGGVYLDISLIVLICSTAAAYGAAVLVKRLSASGDTAVRYTVTICACGTDGNEITLSFEAAADTGNYLTDTITGTPVIVCPQSALLPLTGDREISACTELPRGWRLIPYSTASGSGIMPVFRPKKVIIGNCESGRHISADAYVGIASYPMECAVLNPRAFG